MLFISPEVLRDIGRISDGCPDYTVSAARFSILYQYIGFLPNT